MNPLPGERIAKKLSRAGVCSRREAERWIEAGRITVDGNKISRPGTKVTPTSDIRVDGKPIIQPQEVRLWRYHKPRGLLCTNSDPQRRPIIFDRLPAELPRVMSVGRLDFDSEGVLLLTNDGMLARRLELPETGWVRRYRVRVYGTPGQTEIRALANGIKINTIQYGSIATAVDSTKGSNSWLSVSLREGKNQELRKVFEYLGLPINRLIRTAYGPFQLGKLQKGGVSEIGRGVLKDQLGIKFDHAHRRRQT
tara:strand:+ start:343 stop:1098 length:756 start_codon:yes stop_codon:yes gene_type:complete